MYIQEYENGSYNNHEPKRDRKLLLQRTELKKLERKMKD
ncbi:MAG: SsrA-binding protein, partial [Chitinophagales bacterium]